MADITFFISVITVIVLLFIQPVTVRFRLRQGAEIEIEFIVFALVLSDFQKSTPNSKGTFKKFFDLLPAIKKAAPSLLSAASLDLERLYIATPELQPDKFALLSSNFNSLVSAAYAYLKPKLAEVSVDGDKVALIYGNTAESDVSLRISAPLIRILISALIFSFNLVILKLKRKKENRSK